MPRDHAARRLFEMAEILAICDHMPLAAMAGQDDRLLGRKTLYLGMLRSFVDNHALAGAQLRQALDEGDREGAAALAHAVRGAAATIGADRLALRAGDVKQALREQWPMEMVGSLAELFAAALEELIAALRQQLPPA